MSHTTRFTPAIVVTHIIIIVAAYSSPLWLDWRLVAVGVAIYYLQILIVGGCVLSRAQFEDKEQTFHEWYLRKAGVRVNRRVLNFALRYVVPGIILAGAVLLQTS